MLIFTAHGERGHGTALSRERTHSAIRDNPAECQSTDLVVLEEEQGDRYRRKSRNTPPKKELGIAHYRGS